MRNTQNKSTIHESTTPNTDWDNINWYKVEKHVDKLQKRIYDAESKGDSRKVRDTQRILIYSKSALLLAVKRVTQTNKGRRTPGIDKFRALSSKQRGELVDKLLSRNIALHKPKPTYRKYIKKKNGKLRALGIPTIIDRVYQEIIRMALEPQAEVNFEATSYGFRPKRGPHDAIERIFNNMSRGKWCWIYEADLRACFDNLSHDFILELTKGFPLQKLIKRFLEAGYVDNNVFHITDKGTPQGGLLSPLLANIALTGLEKCLNITYKQTFRKRGDKTYEIYETKGNYRVVRYADDFVIFAATKEDIDKVPQLIQPYLDDRGLELAEEKTNIVHATEGFDFLGFNCRLYPQQNGKMKCFIKPSKSSIKSFKEKANAIFKRLQGHSVDELIKALNPLLIGTAHYWRTSVAKRILGSMDSYIWLKTRKFIKKLHPKKRWKWIKNKYYPLYDDGHHRTNWILTGPKEKNHLFRMDWLPIKRWIMIKNNFSPYDRTKTVYFLNRESKTFKFR